MIFFYNLKNISVKGSSPEGPVAVPGIPSKPDIPEPEQEPMIVDIEHHNHDDHGDRESSVRLVNIIRE